MKLRNILFCLTIALLQFSFQSCEKDMLVETEISAVKVDKEIIEINQRAEEPTALYLVHSEGEAILASDIVELFLDGWEYQELVTISGYTATDDLWTILSYENDYPKKFDKIKIELTKLKKGTSEWEECINDIYERAEELPGIIVLDQDLE
ncbi:MAG: hypothetical protein AB8F74_05890 [Saprospiraceae bacterium]